MTSRLSSLTDRSFRPSSNPNMLRRILVVDNSEEFGRLVGYFIRQEWPKVDVEWHRPASRGKPGAHFRWSEYDLLVIDYQLGIEGENGFQWLQELRDNPDLPPVLVLTDEGDEAMAVRAIKLGAAGYMRKDSLSAKGLNAAIFEALQFDQGIPSSAQLKDTSTRDSREETGMTRGNLRRVLKASGVNLPADADNPEADKNRLRIPGYEIVSLVGEGGTATAFLAKRSEDGLEVVLKVVFTSACKKDPNLLRRFMQEYELIEDIRHKNVVRIYERAFAKDYAYIAMEYFAGGDLKERIKRRISAADALYYLRQITEGLMAAHVNEVVHRDLKPGNVLFRHDSTLAIADFGIAKVLDEERSLTRDDVILGTPYYLSPEQVRDGEVDQRSDLYSLGVILYEMLTSEKPFQGDNVAMLVDAHLRAPIPKLPDKLKAFQPFIEGLLAKDPDERFQSAEEVLTAIEWMRPA